MLLFFLFLFLIIPQLFTSDSYTSLIQVFLEDSSSLPLQSPSAWGFFWLFDRNMIIKPFLPIPASNKFPSLFLLLPLTRFCPSALNRQDIHPVVSRRGSRVAITAGLACDLRDLCEAFTETGCHDTNNPNNTCTV